MKPSLLLLSFYRFSLFLKILFFQIIVAIFVTTASTVKIKVINPYTAEQGF